MQKGVVILGSSVSMMSLVLVIIVVLLQVWHYYSRTPATTAATPQKKCEHKIRQQGWEYTRRVQDTKKKWVCPKGWVDNGCSWNDGKERGELQCRRRLQGSGSSTPADIVRSPFFGDENGGTIGDILLSGGKYADNWGTAFAALSWIKQEGGGIPQGAKECGKLTKDCAVFKDMAREQLQKLEQVKKDGEFVCKPGDWVRTVSLLSQDGWTSNGVYGACYNPNNGTEYILFDGIGKYYPTNPDEIRKSFTENVERDTAYTFNGNVLSGFAGRGFESKKSIQTMWEPLANLFTGAVNNLGSNIPKFQKYNYFKSNSIINADKGITTIDAYTEGNPKRIRALRFVAADGRSVGPIGTTAGMTKTTWSCPNGKVVVGMTPKLAKDEKNRRNTDLTGLSITCGNPAASASQK